MNTEAMKRVAIIQSCYVPWKGFFDLIGRCDEYVLLDGAQYVKRHWHNRNQIKTAQGVQWITIPVITKSRFEQPIDEVQIAEPWADKHWRALELAYRKAPCFDAYGPQVKSWYEAAGRETRLTDVNTGLLRNLMDLLGCRARLTRDRDYHAQATRSERLLDICRKAGATHYLSGPSARDYLDVGLFERAGITVEWMRYGPYPEYSQLHGSFEHAVTILDLIFHLGPDAAAATLPLPLPAELIA
jgi:hypothetical protein